MGTDEQTRVFVQLSYGQGAVGWRKRWENGSQLGVNEPSPYGYHHADSGSMKIDFSVDHPETYLAKVWRYAIRLILGFDLVHAWRNRDGIRASDIVWTHTESQGLAVAWILRRCAAPRPLLLMQSVWLMDRWPHMCPARRWWFQRLLRSADVLTFHSPMNTADARAAFPGHRVELVLYGIAIDAMRKPASPRKMANGTRVLSLGSDRHRDWATLIEAVASSPIELRMVTNDSRANRIARGVPNVEIIQPPDNSCLSQEYDWADIVVVTLMANRHASGVTVVEEATVMGKPVIVTDAGGMDAYFDTSCVTYVRVGDPQSLRDALQRFGHNPGPFHKKIPQAQHRMRDELNSHRYVERHVRLSEELLNTDGDQLHLR